jgi:hypothetical protein
MGEFSSVARRRMITRLAALVSLLAIFSLPLHFHFLAGAKVTKECACVQGTRTQLALGAPPPAYAPLIVAQPVVFHTNSPQSFEWSKLECVRGPPVPLSI